MDSLVFKLSLRQIHIIHSSPQRWTGEKKNSSISIKKIFLSDIRTTYSECQEKIGRLVKDGFFSESAMCFSNLQKIYSNHYPELEI